MLEFFDFASTQRRDGTVSALLPVPERVISLSSAPRDIELPSEVRGDG